MICPALRKAGSSKVIHCLTSPHPGGQPKKWTLRSDQCFAHVKALYLSEPRDPTGKWAMCLPAYPFLWGAGYQSNAHTHCYHSHLSSQPGLCKTCIQPPLPSTSEQSLLLTDDPDHSLSEKFLSLPAALPLCSLHSASSMLSLTTLEIAPGFCLWPWLLCSHQSVPCSGLRSLPPYLQNTDLQGGPSARCIRCGVQGKMKMQSKVIRNFKTTN